MVKTTSYRKLVNRQFSAQKTKFLSMFFIILLSTFFIFGSFAVSPNLYGTINPQYQEVIRDNSSKLQKDSEKTIQEKISNALVSAEEIANYLESVKSQWFDTSKATSDALAYLQNNYASNPQWVGHEQDVILDYINEHADEYTNVEVRDSLAAKYVEEETKDIIKYFVSFKKMVDMINIILSLIASIFMVIILLVCLSNIYKKVDNERLLIGGLSSLGFSGDEIRNIYVTYTTLPTTLGVIGGILSSFYALPYMIRAALMAMFSSPLKLPPLSIGWYYTYSSLAIAMIFVIVIVSTIIFVNANLKEIPYLLLRAKAPLPGKKIILEKIPLLWKSLAFKYKSMFKNIFRYKKNSLLTILGTASSLILIVAAIGLNKSVDNIEGSSSIFQENMTSIKTILYVVLGFALVLSVMIVFSSISLAIDERKKEIATLAVLGYRKNEIVMYIYREQSILIAIGLILGLILGHFALYGIIYAVRIQDIPMGVGIYISNYLLPLAFSILLIAITMAIMARRFKDIDMVSSLKATE